MRQVFAEYIWVGATGADLKSRSVVLDEYQPGCSPDDLPIAAIDGGEYTEGEIYLQPKKVYPDPFRGGNHILVLCDVYSPPLVSSASCLLLETNKCIGRSILIRVLLFRRADVQYSKPLGQSAAPQQQPPCRVRAGDEACFTPAASVHDAAGVHCKLQWWLRAA